MTATATAVRERPILFSGPMVRALLDGRKTQTRRVVKPPMWFVPPLASESMVAGAILNELPRRYGAPGDRLWVREAYAAHGAFARFKTGRVWYRADENPGQIGPWKPSIHMPRWACRLVLELTAVRVERVQDTSDDDAIAEGVVCEDLGPDPDNFHPPGSFGYVSGLHPFPKGRIHVRPRQAYRELWDALNAKRGVGWDVNPWVWVLTFRRVEVTRG